MRPSIVTLRLLQKQNWVFRSRFSQLRKNTRFRTQVLPLVVSLTFNKKNEVLEALWGSLMKQIVQGYDHMSFSGTLETKRTMIFFYWPRQMCKWRPSLPLQKSLSRATFICRISSAYNCPVFACEGSTMPAQRHTLVVEAIQVSRLIPSAQVWPLIKRMSRCLIQNAFPQKKFLRWPSVLATTEQNPPEHLLCFLARVGWQLQGKKQNAEASDEPHSSEFLSRKKQCETFWVSHHWCCRTLWTS